MDASIFSYTYSEGVKHDWLSSESFVLFWGIQKHKGLQKAFKK